MIKISGITPLHFAAENGTAPFHFAAKYGHLKVFCFAVFCTTRKSENTHPKKVNAAVGSLIKFIYSEKATNF